MPAVRSGGRYSARTAFVMRGRRDSWAFPLRRPSRGREGQRRAHPRHFLERIWAELCAALKADKRYDNPRDMRG
ncbi:MAG: hypothetical protein ACLS4Z_10530 [Christensenellaceae bacterium]